MMKKTAFFLCVAFIGYNLYASDYYLSHATGNDENNGKSAGEAFRTLDRIRDLDLKPGDRILLRKGDVFLGNIELKGLSGEKGNPICITSYGTGNTKPVIDASGLLNGILIEDCSYITVSGIEITANGGGGTEHLDPSGRHMRCGVFITTGEEGDYGHITVEGVHVRDVFFEEPGFDRGSAEVLTGNGNQNYGWGIRIINSLRNAMLSDILVKDCHIENVAHSGIRFTGNHGLGRGNRKNIRNISVINNRVIRVGGPALQASVAENVVFRGNQTDYSGCPDDSRKWGRGSGLWVWGCLNVLIEKNSFRNAKGPADSAGSHIDFNNKNVLIQYNLSENNDGGFIEILGNNHNCTYRYNVSINDGSRKWEKDRTLGAGTMMGVNGFVGFGNKPKGPFNTYIYNNTIYAKEDIKPEVGFASTVDGMLIAINVIYLESPANADHRKNFQPSAGPIPRVVFKNNLYLRADNWPDADKVMITDQSPVYGDPEFVNKGGLEIEDYIPQNAGLIKDKAIDIEKIPSDTVGLWGGFKLDVDILGNPITGQPDMGAIEMK